MEFVFWLEFKMLEFVPLLLAFFTLTFKFASGLKVFEFVLKFIILNPFFSINLKRYIGILGVAFKKFCAEFNEKFKFWIVLAYGLPRLLKNNAKTSEITAIMLNL